MNAGFRPRVLLLCLLLIFACCVCRESDAASPIDAMNASMKAQLGAKSYRYRLEGSYDGKANPPTIVEYVAPDSWHITQGENGKDETIIVGENAYTTALTGKWTRLPMALNYKQLISGWIDEARKSIDVTLLGTDTVGGMPMKVYLFTGKDLLGNKNTSKAWVSVSDSLPRKVEVEGDIKGKHYKSLATYYDYNADIKIEPPPGVRSLGK